MITGQTVLLDREESFAAGPEVCGGKGYNLGRLHRYGVSERARGRRASFTIPTRGPLVGEVLVAPSTDHGWTPLFLRGSAVVNNFGILSDLQSGEPIGVDGDTGRAIREQQFIPYETAIPGTLPAD